VALWATGQTINLMTLGGLALAVGILVDEATVFSTSTWVFDPTAKMCEERKTPDGPPKSDHYSTRLRGVRIPDVSLRPQANKWKEPKRSPDPAYRNRFGLVYDSKNRVVLLVDGSNTWDTREENFNDVWTCDPAVNTWTKQAAASPAPSARRREGRVCAYDPDSNVAFYLNDALWAHRYKK
jgi:hypothetical protein